MPYYDLSHEISETMPVYPGSEPPDIETRKSYQTTDNGVFSGGMSKTLTLNNHHGTHIDAPSHMLEGGATLDEFEVSVFAFNAWTVDCTEKGDNEVIEPSDIPAGTNHDMVIINTGRWQYWGTEKYIEHPYLSAEAAAKCAENGYHVGVDLFSPDPIPDVDHPHQEGTDKRFPAHTKLFRGGRLIVENLTNLDQLPREVTLYAFPLAIGSADGSPVRAIGVSK